MLAYSPLSWCRYNINSTRNLALRLNHMTYSLLYSNEHEDHTARQQSFEARENVTNFVSVCFVPLSTHNVFYAPKELWEAYSNRTVSPSVSPSLPLRVRCISPIFFEVGFPNLVCVCILGWRSVAYHFRTL